MAVDGLDQRARGRDHVVDDDDVLALHIAHDMHRLGLLVVDAPLIDDRQAAVHALGVSAGRLYAADVRRDDDEIFVDLQLPDIFGKYRERVQMVERYIEEPLYLPGVQIDRQHPVGSRRRSECSPRASPLSALSAGPYGPAGRIRNTAAPP